MKYIFSLSFLLLWSCTNTEIPEDKPDTQNALKAAEVAIAKMQNQETEANNAKLVHMVFFKLKPDADATQMLREIGKLEEINSIVDLEYGLFEDLGDARALSDYDILMQMSFADSVAYNTYQNHPLHLTLKKNTLNLLAGPPATYDYIKN